MAEGSKWLSRVTLSLCRKWTFLCKPAESTRWAPHPTHQSFPCTLAWALCPTTGAGELLCSLGGFLSWFRASPGNHWTETAQREGFVWRFLRGEGTQVWKSRSRLKEA